MDIESILISLPKEVVDFLKLRRYFADQVLFYEDIIQPQETPEGFNNYVRDRSHKMYFEAENYYKDKGYHMSKSLSNCILEPIKNANFYGGRPDYHMITIRGIFSKVAMITSYNDGGDYFKNPKIKYEFENRINSKESFGKRIENNKGERFVGTGLGKEIMFIVNDLIYVDTNEGTLYNGILKDNVLFGRKK